MRACEQGKWKNGGRIITFRVGIGVAFLNPRVTVPVPIHMSKGQQMK